MQMSDATNRQCANCGRQAVGTAHDGRAYCHRKECIDWKLVRLARIALKSCPHCGKLYAETVDHHCEDVIAEKAA